MRNSHLRIFEIIKVSKVAKIRNRYNQVPHLTQDTNGKVTNSQKTPQTRTKRSALSFQNLAKWRNHTYYLLMKLNHFIVANFCVTNMCLYTIREDKILANNSEFTVLHMHLDIYL